MIKGAIVGDEREWEKGKSRVKARQGDTSICLNLWSEPLQMKQDRPGSSRSVAWSKMTTVTTYCRPHPPPHTCIRITCSAAHSIALITSNSAVPYWFNRGNRAVQHRSWILEPLVRLCNSMSDYCCPPFGPTWNASQMMSREIVARYLLDIIYPWLYPTK